MGDALVGKGKFDDAVGVYKRALKLYRRAKSNNPSGIDNSIATILSCIGMSFFTQGKHDKAIDSMEDAIATFPSPDDPNLSSRDMLTLAQVHFSVAICNRSKGNIALAKSHAKKSVKIFKQLKKLGTWEEVHIQISKGAEDLVRLLEGRS